jgi:hypothetical protein
LNKINGSTPLAAIRVNKTESRFEASLNRLLQQNQPEADVPRFPPNSNMAVRVETGRGRIGPLLAHRSTNSHLVGAPSLILVGER